MDKQEIIEFIDDAVYGTENRIRKSDVTKEQIAMENAVMELRIIKKYLYQLDEPEITIGEAWGKIAEDKGYTVAQAQNIFSMHNFTVVDRRDGLFPAQIEKGRPEIPRKLAEIIENLRNAGCSDEYIVYDIYTDKETDMIDSDIERWMNDNEGLLTKAVENGYTIEKEPVWIVKINEKLYFCRFTDKYFEENSDEPTYSESGNPELVKKFTDKAKAEAVATLINGEVEEWSE